MVMLANCVFDLQEGQAIYWQRYGAYKNIHLIIHNPPTPLFSWGTMGQIASSSLSHIKSSRGKWLSGSCLLQKNMGPHLFHLNSNSCRRWTFSERHVPQNQVSVSSWVTGLTWSQTVRHPHLHSPGTYVCMCTFMERQRVPTSSLPVCSHVCVSVLACLTLCVFYRQTYTQGAHVC